MAVPVILQIAIALLIFVPLIHYRCLEETGWDISKAEIAFRAAHQEGKIPIEAFEQ